MQPISPEGAIDEAVQTREDVLRGRRAGFVNGVLDAILREVRENEAHEHALRITSTR